MKRRVENEYGLTLAEWRASADLGRDPEDCVNDAMALRAWRAGEDPTEYAAAPQGTFVAQRNRR